MHLTRQAVEITTSEKKNPNKPAINAPKKLVAGKEIPRRIVENNTVPKTPASKEVIVLQVQEV